MVNNLNLIMAEISTTEVLVTMLVKRWSNHLNSLGYIEITIMEHLSTLTDLIMVLEEPRCYSMG